MKKILTIISLAVLVAACQDMYGPIPVPQDPVYSAGIDVQVSQVMDNSFSVTLTPKSEALFYSYLVTEGSTPEVLDSAKLYSLSYKGVQSGKFNYAEQTSATVELTDLKPNTAYQVYAVAGSKTGIPSSVAVQSVFTTDGVAPAPTKIERSGNKVVLTFSENISYDESKSVTGVGYAKVYASGSPVVANATAKVSVSGNAATIEFPDFKTPGTYYSIAYPAGTFVDAKGNACKAIDAGKFTVSVDGKYIVTYSGALYGYIANADMVYKLPEIKSLYLKDYGKTISVNVPDGVARVDLKDGYLTVISHKGAAGQESTTKWPMAKMTNYYGTYYDVVVKLAGEAEAGDMASIVIPAGAVMDWYGNVNASDITVGPIEIMSEPLKLTFEDAGIGSCSANIAVTTNDISGKKYWIWDYDSKAAMAEVSDEDFIEFEYGVIAGYAEEDGLSFEEELVQYFAYQGDDEISIANLLSKSEYQIAGFFMDGEGNAISDVFRFDFTTEALVVPTETSGTYNFALWYKVAQKDLPFSVEKADDVYVCTISGAGNGFDFTFEMDEDGNCMVPQTSVNDAYSYAGSNYPIYLEEIYSWNDGWSSTSYYDQAAKTFVFNLVYYIDLGYLSYGTAGETFVLDAGESASAAPASVNAFRPGVSKLTASKKISAPHSRKN